ncbi:hypothetical protein BYT27DRAFT_7205886 [Phlegmacium glaucopus]|nr:hypothetical protein BYT27DRAFT_7205886 [Phlegmacium glaucopus]
MNLNLIARLRTLTSRLNESRPNLDLQGRRERFIKRLNTNKPANTLERFIFNTFEFSVVVPIIGLSFLLQDGFRERVYYLYEHPDHDDHHCLYPYLMNRHPYTTRWLIYLFPKVKNIWQKYLRFSQALKVLVPTYKSSPPMFGLTPKLAIVVHGAGEWAEELKIPYGCIRIHYSPSFEDGRYTKDSEFTPMLSMDLPVTRAGVDLNPLYKEWGIESIAFIVDNVFRPVFKPADNRGLSPTAAYDLSKHFTTPVRVFEPEVSKYTINKRRLHYPLFILGFFFISLIALVGGEPTDRVYLCNLYGHRYADIYECLSRWSNGPRNATKIVFRALFHWAALFFSAITFSIFLFAQVVFTTIRWVLMTALAAPGWSLRKCVAVLVSVSVRILDTVGLAFSLQWKTWAIAIPACWMLYLEFRQMVVG